ncbi:hypothetical protein [Terribacillus aidingensis]
MKKHWYLSLFILVSHHYFQSCGADDSSSEAEADQNKTIRLMI